MEVRRGFGRQSTFRDHVSADPGWGSIADDYRRITECDDSWAGGLGSVVHLELVNGGG
jgi:hypothetical protein